MNYRYFHDEKRLYSANNMEPSLTKNVIPLLLNGSTKIQPLLQIIDIIFVTSEKTTSPHFHINLSDGTHQHKTLLPATYYAQIASEYIQVDSIILLKKVACMMLQYSS